MSQSIAYRLFLIAICIVLTRSANTDETKPKIFAHKLLFVDKEMSSLTQKCLKNIPFSKFELCNRTSYEKYSGGFYPLRTQCCAKWANIECLEKFVFNNIYCDLHQRQAVDYYFKQIRENSPECKEYRPVAEEESHWTSKLGRIAKCKKQNVPFHIKSFIYSE